MRWFTMLLVVCLLGSASTTLAKIDHNSVVWDEITHVLKRGFVVDKFDYVVMDPEWDAVTIFHEDGVRATFIINVDERWSGHTRANAAHELAHAVIRKKGLRLDYKTEEEPLAQKFAACYGTYSARVWLRIHEGVRPTKVECEGIRVLLGGN